MQEYLDAGVKLGWLINPKKRQVGIYRLGQDKQVLQQPATLFGEAILPGFVLDLELIWQTDQY